MVEDRTENAVNKKDFQCVQCGFQMKSLYIQYSPGNIRLMKCTNCYAVADEYIECEVMILLIDLILHKPKAYRHLFYNMFNRENLNFEGLLWRLTIGFLLLDAYRIWVLNREEWMSPTGLASVVWIWWQMFLDVVLGNLLFMCMFLLGIRKFLSASVGVSSYKDMVLAILVSSYFKAFLITMTVWEFPSSVIFIADIFVLSSNTVALNVITESAMARCLGVCLAAHAVKFIASGGLSIHHPVLFI